MVLGMTRNRSDDPTSRRAFLGLVSGAMVGVAGCFGGGDGDTPTDGIGADTAATTASTVSTPGDTSTPPSTSTDPGAPSGYGLGGYGLGGYGLGEY
jgi:hypothetical protein